MNCCLQNRKKSVFCRLRFLILGRSEGKEKKTKIFEKESGGRRPGTSAYPWSLETTRCGYKVNMVHWRRKKSTMSKSNANRENLLLCLRFKWQLFEKMCHCLLRNLFGKRENLDQSDDAKQKKIFFKKLVSVIFILQQFNVVYLFVYAALSLFIRITVFTPISAAPE